MTIVIIMAIIAILFIGFVILITVDMTMQANWLYHAQKWRAELRQWDVSYNSPLWQCVKKQMWDFSRQYAPDLTMKDIELQTKQYTI